MCWSILAWAVMGTEQCGGHGVRGDLPAENTLQEHGAGIWSSAACSQLPPELTSGAAL